MPTMCSQQIKPQNYPHQQKPNSKPISDYLLFVSRNLPDQESSSKLKTVKRITISIPKSSPFYHLKSHEAVKSLKKKGPSIHLVRMSLFSTKRPPRRKRKSVITHPERILPEHLRSGFYSKPSEIPSTPSKTESQITISHKLRADNDKIVKPSTQTHFYGMFR